MGGKKEESMPEKEWKTKERRRKEERNVRGGVGEERGEDRFVFRGGEIILKGRLTEVHQCPVTLLIKVNITQHTVPGLPPVKS